MSMREIPKNNYTIWVNVYVFFLIMAAAMGLATLVALLVRLSEGGSGSGGVVIAVLGLQTVVLLAVTLVARRRSRHELQKIDTGVSAHLSAASAPIALTMWRPKATIFQTWPEAYLAVDNGIVTVQCDGETVLEGPAGAATVKVGFRALRLKCNGRSVELFPYSVNNTFNLRAREFLFVRAAELRAAFQGLQPDWVPMPSVEQTAATLPAQVVPAGWYPDPHGAARLRWWDGARWTDHTG
jgi:hypothetical protein